MKEYTRGSLTGAKVELPDGTRFQILEIAVKTGRGHSKPPTGTGVSIPILSRTIGTRESNIKHGTFGNYGGKLLSVTVFGTVIE